MQTLTSDRVELPYLRDFYCMSLITLVSFQTLKLKHTKDTSYMKKYIKYRIINLYLSIGIIIMYLPNY